MSFWFYALVSCLCLYGGDDTLIVRDVAMTFADRTLVAKGPTRSTIVHRGR
jgi:hypothetical protein